MKYIIALYSILILTGTANAQHTTTGKIEYERKTNVHRTMEAMKEDGNDWFERFKSQVPKFRTDYFELYFNTVKSTYKPGKESGDDKNKMWFTNVPGSENTVYTDFTTKTVKANKDAYEETFLVQDSMRKLDWKITDEIRIIANYKCRKAVSKICDSVYVVAFYTEDIIAMGGPEMFGGLPGMILELAIPRLYTTWVATKVESTTLKDTDFVIPEKGKKTTQKALHEVIAAGVKNWGKSATRNVWWAML